MPQDNLRSVIYKSFVTCDDPRGVVDCRTFRKSNTNSKKSEEELQHPKMLKKLKNATLHKKKKKEMVSKGGTERSQSRGAQKLNQLIDSWSKHTSFDRKSNNIANDMSMGALDLQDSLVMLSTLQEASQHMTKLKEKRIADDVGVKRTSSDRFGNPYYQNPRLSDDGSSRDCHEQLREVIRNSLARQKLLPPNSFKERTYIHKSKATHKADMTSPSSSSMSSMAYSHDFASFESTCSWKNPEMKKPRSSNLIAKLMGLEDFSSKSFKSALPKQLQRDSDLTHKLISDTDMQNGRKPQVVGQKVDRGCMTLENIIDSMQFKGLLKSDGDPSDTERRLSNAASHIVLIRPTHPGIKAEEHFQRQMVQERAALDSKKKQKFRKTKEETTSKIMEYHRGDFNSNESRRKLQSREPPIKKLSPQKEAKTSRKVFTKPGDIEVIIGRKQFSNKINASVALSSLPQNNQMVEKKVDKIQKNTIRKEQVEIQSVKHKTTSVPTSPEEDRDTTIKLRKPETGSNIMMKNCISQKTSTTCIPKLKHTNSSLTYAESDQKRSTKNRKPVKEPLTANVPSMVCNNNNKLTNLKEKSNTSIIDSPPALQLATEEETDVAAVLIQANCDDLITLCKDLILPFPYEKNTKCPDEATDYHQRDLRETIFCQTETTSDVMISTTQESLQVIEPPNNCDAYQLIVLETPTNSNDSELLNSKHLRDCADELLESRRESNKLHTIPFLHVPVSDSRVCMSKDKLMEEARDEIENLRSCSNQGVHSVPDIDIVFSVLERDILCKGLAAGAWDVGWREGFTRNEVEKIVNDFDRQVTDQLIEEVLADLVVWHCSSPSSNFVA